MIYDEAPYRPRPGNPQRVKTTRGVCLDDDKIGRRGFRTLPNHQELAVVCQRRKNIPATTQFGYGRSGFEGYLAMLIYVTFVSRSRAQSACLLGIKPSFRDDALIAPVDIRQMSGD